MRNTVSSEGFSATTVSVRIIDSRSWNQGGETVTSTQRAVVELVIEASTFELECDFAIQNSGGDLFCWCDLSSVSVRHGDEIPGDELSNALPVIEQSILEFLHTN